MSTILIIDDDDAIRSMLGRALQFAGHEVLEAKTGCDAEKMVASRPPDLVVTDIIMPDMDGLEFIFHLRQVRPEIPVIAISGGGRIPGRQYLEMARSAGASVTIEKPLELEQLLRAIDEQLGH
jgi:DNA-binding NtrC family response regulator